MVKSKKKRHFKDNINTFEVAPKLKILPNLSVELDSNFAKKARNVLSNLEESEKKLKELETAGFLKKLFINKTKIMANAQRAQGEVVKLNTEMIAAIGSMQVSLLKQQEVISAQQENILSMNNTIQDIAKDCDSSISNLGLLGNDIFEEIEHLSESSDKTLKKISALGAKYSEFHLEFMGLKEKFDRTNSNIIKLEAELGILKKTLLDLEVSIEGDKRNAKSILQQLQSDFKKSIDSLVEANAKSNLDIEAILLKIESTECTVASVSHQFDLIKNRLRHERYISLILCLACCIGLFYSFFYR